MFAFPLRKTSSETRRSRPARIRQLGFVTLEERNLLTVIDPLPIPPEPTDPPPEPPSDIAPTGDVFDGIGGGGTIGDGGGGDTGGGDTGSGDTGSGDTGGGEENQAPTLYGFTVSESGGIYEFSGYVKDDADPAGLYVYFDGLLSGAYCEVMTDGYFNFQITLEDPCGQVSAIFADAEWLWSNQEYVTL